MKDSENNKNIFSITGHLTKEQLVQYHLGQMSKAELHEVEKHLVDCELCKDALSGMAVMPDYKGIDRIRKDLRKIIKPKRGPMYDIAWRNVVITIVVLSLLLLIALYYIYFIGKMK